jgi:hypothetical protein
LAASSTEIACTTPSAALIRHFAGAFRRLIAAAVAWRCRYVKRQTEVLAEKIGVAEAMGAKVGRLRINPVIDRRIRRNS